MKAVLQANNQDILREIRSLRESLQGKHFAPELTAYYNWVLSFLHENELIVKDNLDYLSLNIDSILREVLERTQSVTLNIRILSAKYISPLKRYSNSDIICIKILQWLHDQHPQSKDIAFAVSDGSFSIYPSTDIPVIYYLPTSSQNSLLHLPLFFHEYGHYLFEYHRKEMIDYIITMQDGMEELLLQPFQQNDTKSQRDRVKAKNIIETWFDWIEELFCDLVGLTIGGRAFLNTFSLYLRMGGKEAFYLGDRELENSSHPVAWIRIKFLVERARRMGMMEEANLIETEWANMAKLMDLIPIYHGYYAPSYDDLINQALDYMIEEASPINYVDKVSTTKEYVYGSDNYVQLVTSAWIRQQEDHDAFEFWEKEILGKFEKLGSVGPYFREEEISINESSDKTVLKKAEAGMVVNLPYD